MVRFRHQRRQRNNRNHDGACCQNCFTCRKSEPLTLDHLKPGETAVICSLGCEGALRRRLLDMGLTPNTSVMVRKVAPFGDPIELFLRNYELTIRKEDASLIRIREAETKGESSLPAESTEALGTDSQIAKMGEAAG